MTEDFVWWLQDHGYRPDVVLTGTVLLALHAIYEREIAAEEDIWG